MTSEQAAVLLSVRAVSPSRLVRVPEFVRDNIFKHAGEQDGQQSSGRVHGARGSK